MNKALLPLLLCCFIFPASGKDAGWQWYNEKINPKEKENKPVAYFHERRSLNNFHRDRVITFEQIAE
ncbi:hypothetical protein FCY01_21980 [Escherichia coli]|nr:hypothetical protein [Escherichia coli]MDN0593232.1 hypothetical protein [Escherichia coli]